MSLSSLSSHTPYYPSLHDVQLEEAVRLTQRALALVLVVHAARVRDETAPEARAGEDRQCKRGKQREHDEQQHEQN